MEFKEIVKKVKNGEIKINWIKEGEQFDPLYNPQGKKGYHFCISNVIDVCSAMSGFKSQINEDECLRLMLAYNDEKESGVSTVTHSPVTFQDLANSVKGIKMTPSLCYPISKEIERKLKSALENG